MKATKNFYHINIDEKDLWNITIGGNKLFFDPEYNPDHTAIQYGTVRTTAMSITKQANMIQPVNGDSVYFHHHVFTNKITFEEDCFRFATHSQLFFIIRDEKIIMLNDFLLVKPKMESEDEIKQSGIFMKSKAEKIQQRGIVVATTDQAKSMGIEADMEIAFSRNSDYSFYINDEEYYMMTNQDVIGYIKEDGDIVPVGQWTLVEPLDEHDEYEESSSGILLKVKEIKSNKHRGLIYKTLNKWLGIKDGDKVVYDRKAFYSILVNDKKYYGVNAERDIFILL